MAANTSKRADLRPEETVEAGSPEFDRDEATTGSCEPEDSTEGATVSPLRTSATAGQDGGRAQAPRDDQKVAGKGDRRRDVAAAPKKASPFQRQRDRVQSTWLSKLSKFAPDAMWYAKRVGPPYYRGRKTKIGVYPKPFMGPVSPETIAG